MPTSKIDLHAIDREIGKAIEKLEFAHGTVAVQAQRYLGVKIDKLKSLQEKLKEICPEQLTIRFTPPIMPAKAKKKTARRRKKAGARKGP